MPLTTHAAVCIGEAMGGVVEIAWEQLELGTDPALPAGPRAAALDLCAENLGRAMALIVFWHDCFDATRP